MAGDRRAAKVEPGKPCKKCEKPTFTAADGKLRHDLRVAEAAPKEKTGDQVPPRRDHPMHRLIGGKTA